MTTAPEPERLTDLAHQNALTILRLRASALELAILGAASLSTEESLVLSSFAADIVADLLTLTKAFDAERQLRAAAHA